MIIELPTFAWLWLATYALHSTLLLGGAWLFDRCCRRAAPSLRAALWRVALVGAIATATLHTTGLVEPVSGALRIGAPISSTATRDDVRAFGNDPTGATPTSIAASRRTAVSVEDAPRADASPGPAEIRADAVAASPVAESSREPAFAVQWRALLPALWFGGALLLVLRLTAMLARGRRALGDRQPRLHGPLLERIGAIAAAAGLSRLPRLSTSARIDGPLTLPHGEICIPDWAERRLPSSQLDAMLAHEMAHWLRRDALWLVIGALLQAVLFFQPLNAIARKRIGALAELAADDWSAARTGRGDALAKCLATFATAAQRRPAPFFAAAMAHRPGALVERVQRLLEGRHARGTTTPGARLALAVVATLGIVALPGVVAQTFDTGTDTSGPELRLAQAERDTFDEPDDFDDFDAPDDFGDPPDPPDPVDPVDPVDAVDSVEPVEPVEPAAPAVRVMRADDGGPISVSMRRRGYRLDLEADGEIALAPDGSGVASLGAGAYIDATITRRDARRVRFEGRNGAVEREFWIDGEPRAWGGEADALVEELMLYLFRSTGISAPERAAWLLDNGGPDRLLGEIAEMGSDSVQHLYSALLLDTGTLERAQLRRLIELAGENMGSDSSLSRLLTSAYLSQQPTGEALTAFVDAALTIGSDSQARMFLETVVDALPPEGMSAVIEVGRTMGSDSQLRSVLTRMIGRADVGDDSIAAALELAGDTIGSDSELRAVLTTAAPRVGRSDRLAVAYLDAAESIGSDSQARAAFTALALQADLSAESWRMLLRGALSVGSDSEAAALLATIQEAMPRDAQTLAAYRRVLDSIGSSSQARRAALRPI